MLQQQGWIEVTIDVSYWEVTQLVSCILTTADINISIYQIKFNKCVFI